MPEQKVPIDFSHAKEKPTVIESDKNKLQNEETQAFQEKGEKLNPDDIAHEQENNENVEQSPIITANISAS